MNTLFIIGNGFDLAHGLKTRYSDFIVHYLQSKLKDTTSKNFYDYDLARVVFKKGIHYEFNSIEGFFQVSRAENIEWHPRHSFFGDLVHKFQESNWVDIEHYYYKNLLDLYFSHERKAHISNFNIVPDVMRLNGCLNDIKNCLIKYLTTIELPPKNRKIQDHMQKAVANTMAWNSSHSGLLTSQILFLIFNYTNTINIYDEYLPSDITSKIYIHGNINNPNNPIIFGYGDETDDYYQKIERLNLNVFLDNIKSFSYLKTDNYLKLSSFIESQAFAVYIMGHSCGLSDRVLLKSIFENENCENIKIFYHDRGDNSNDFFEKTQEISRHFSADLKDVMRRRIISLNKCESLN